MFGISLEEPPKDSECQAMLNVLNPSNKIKSSIQTNENKSYNAN